MNNIIVTQKENVLKEKTYNSHAIEKAFSDFIRQPVWVVSKVDDKKKPFDPKTGNYASIKDSSTWATFSQADDFCKKQIGYAPAIALTPSLGLVCVDLDNMYNPLDGTGLEVAQDIINNLESYTEHSISKTGRHIFGAASKPGNQTVKNLGVVAPGNTKPAKVEIFDSHFVTVTGHVEKNLDSIKQAQPQLNRLYADMFKEEISYPTNLKETPTLSDEQVLALCYKAGNGEKFKSLFDQGNLSNNHGDASAADLALCVILAFYTQDILQLDRLFRQSKLYRDKWERSDYKEKTIRKALSSLTTTYQPSCQVPSYGQTSWENPPKIEDGDNLEMEFPLNELPEVLKNAVEEVSKVNHIDPAIVALPGIGITGLQIGKKALIQEKEGLEHHPSLFLVGVMESGGRKSQGYDSMIRDIDKAIELEEIEYEEKKAAVKAANNSLEELETVIRRNLRDGTIKEEDAKRALEDLYKRKQKEPAHPCNYGDDLSPQRLFQKLAAYDGAYGVFSGEGRAILQKILKGSQEGDTGESIYIAGMWGDRIARSRVGSNKGDLGGEDLLIRKPALTVTCFVQEDVWEGLSKNKIMRQSGLISRINLVIPKSQMGTRIEEVGDKSIDKARINPFTEAVIRIRRWKPEKTGIVKLSSRAADRRREFFNSIEKELGPNGAYEDVKDIATKAISLCARLALIFSLLEIASKGEIPIEIPPITEEQWLRAQSVQEYFLAQAIDAQRTHSKTGTKHLLQKTAKWISRQKFQEDVVYISASQIIKHIRGASETVVEESIIPDLIKLDWIRAAGQTRKKKTRYEVNPRVFDEK